MSLDEHFVSEDAVVKISSDLPTIMDVTLDEIDMEGKEKTRLRLRHEETGKDLEFDVVYDTDEDGQFDSGYRVLMHKGNGEYVDLLPVLQKPFIHGAFENLDAFLEADIDVVDGVADLDKEVEEDE